MTVNTILPSTPITQTNLKKKITATANILKDIKTTTILLLQEPYATKYSKIPSIPTSHKCFIANTKGKPRTAIIVPTGLHKFSIRLGQFSNLDTTTIRISLGNKSIILCSSYMDITFSLPDPTLSALCQYCNINKVPLIIGTDSNSRHTLWRDKLTNMRGRKLLDFISTHSLNIANKGNDPTFRSKQGSSLIDLTLYNNFATDLIQNWNSSFDKSDSDHARINFNLDLIPPKRVPYRNPNDCDWELYNKTIEETLTKDPFTYSPLGNTTFLNKINDKITNLLNMAFNSACPLKMSRKRTSAPWWTFELTQKRRSIRIIHRKARRLKTDQLWNLYKQGQTEYRKLINTTKTKHWRAHTEKISNLPSASRLHNFLKDRGKPTAELGSINKPDGTTTTSPHDTLVALANELLPHDNPAPTNITDLDENHEAIINKIITPHRLNKVCQDLPKNKSPGPDNIRMSMIASCWDTISPCILHLFKHSLRLGITPDNWHKATGVIIAKPHKSDYSNPRSFRVISLTSALQKMLEKLIVWYIESDFGLEHLTTTNQHGFKRNFSTDSAIHKLTRKIENSISNGNQALGIFLDIEGAFDNISFTAIKDSLERHRLPPTISNWIYFMVSNRTIALTLSGCTITRTISRGCPQGGVLSPFLWNLTLNNLLEHQNLDPTFVQAFADDLSILIGGIDIPTLRAKCQLYLNIINRWCKTIGVKLSTVKTTTIMFTRKRKWTLDKPLRIEGQTLTLETTVRYLGVTLDSKLNWIPHIDTICNKAITNLHTAKSYCSKTWGLRPFYMRWIYTQIIQPGIKHGSVVWIHRLDNNCSLRKKLTQVQRSALLLITGAFNTTPTDFLEILAGLLPLDLSIKQHALLSSLRLRSTHNWMPGNTVGKLQSHATYLNSWTNLNLPPFNLHDTSKQLLNVSPPFSTIILDRTSITSHIELLHMKLDTIAYTDGSLKNSLSGGGIVIYKGSTFSEHFFRLGTGPTIFQAELLAIANLCDILIDQEAENTPTTHICTDSKSAILSLTATTINSKTVLLTQSKLRLLSHYTTISIIWVPAHTGITGNELADKLANLGSDNPPTGPPPFAPFSSSTLKDMTTFVLKQEQLHRLQGSRDPHSFNHRLILKAFEDYHPSLFSRSKTDIRTLTHIITGWNYLKHFQYKIGNEPSDICDKCSLDKETSEHYLTSCIAHCTHRLAIFGQAILSTETLLNKGLLPRILKFIRATKYIDYYEPP